MMRILLRQSTKLTIPMALAIFDLDNTLLGGDSDHSWGEFLVAQGVVDSATFSAANDRFLDDYNAGSLDIHAYQRFALAPLVGKPPEELVRLHNRFMQEVILPLKLTKADELLNSHRHRGDRLLVITATNRFVVEPIIRSLGIDEFLATEPEQINGRITGNIVGTPTFQQGKVTALYHWLENQQQTMNGSYFYSDSINDLPLLLMVDNPVAVDPDPSLRAEAEQRNWEIVSLRN